MLISKSEILNVHEEVRRHSQQALRALLGAGYPVKTDPAGAITQLVADLERFAEYKNLYFDDLLDAAEDMVRADKTNKTERSAAA